MIDSLRGEIEDVPAGAESKNILFNSHTLFIEKVFWSESSDSLKVIYCLFVKTKNEMETFCLCGSFDQIKLTWLDRTMKWPEYKNPGK